MLIIFRIQQYTSKFASCTYAMPWGFNPQTIVVNISKLRKTWNLEYRLQLLTTYSDIIKSPLNNLHISKIRKCSMNILFNFELN